MEHSCPKTLPETYASRGVKSTQAGEPCKEVHISLPNHISCWEKKGGLGKRIQIYLISSLQSLVFLGNAYLVSLQMRCTKCYYFILYHRFDLLLLYSAFVFYVSSFLHWKMPSPLKTVLPLGCWCWPSLAGKFLSEFVDKFIKLLSVKLTKQLMLQRTLNFILIPDESRWNSQGRSLKLFLWVITPRLNKVV